MAASVSAFWRTKFSNPSTGYFPLEIDSVRSSIVRSTPAALTSPRTPCAPRATSPLTALVLLPNPNAALAFSSPVPPVEINSPLPTSNTPFWLRSMPSLTAVGRSSTTLVGSDQMCGTPSISSIQVPKWSAVPILLRLASMWSAKEFIHACGLACASATENAWVAPRTATDIPCAGTSPLCSIVNLKVPPPCCTVR